MTYPRAILAACLVLSVVGGACTDEPNSSCATLCAKASDCGLAISECADVCETGAAEAALVGPELGHDFQSVVDCATELSCEQLNALLNGTTSDSPADECASGCDACDRC